MKSELVIRTPDDIPKDLTDWVAWDDQGRPFIACRCSSGLMSGDRFIHMARLLFGQMFGYKHEDLIHLSSWQPTGHNLVVVRPKKAPTDKQMLAYESHHLRLEDRPRLQDNSQRDRVIDI